MKPPVFQTTKQDLMLELRDIRLEINKGKSELETISRRLAEYDIWAKSEGQAAKDFLEDVKTEVEYVQFKELKDNDELLESRKHDLENTRISYSNLCKEVKTQQDILSDIKSKIIQAKNASANAKEQVKADEERREIFMQDSKAICDAIKSEIRDLNKEVETIRIEIRRGTKQVDEDKEYNTRWQEFLRSKERDLRLWEVRLARKLKKEFPNKELKFKEWDGKIKQK